MFRMLLLLTPQREVSWGTPQGEKVRNYDYETLCW
jgi:hypothetical protein